MSGYRVEGATIDVKPSVARAARAYTGMSHVALAKAAGVASRTVYKLEKDGKVTQESLDKIVEALRRGGVTMTYTNRGLVIGMTFQLDN